MKSAGIPPNIEPSRQGSCALPRVQTACMIAMANAMFKTAANTYSEQTAWILSPQQLQAELEFSGRARCGDAAEVGIGHGAVGI